MSSGDVSTASVELEPSLPPTGHGRHDTSGKNRSIGFMTNPTLESSIPKGKLLPCPEDDSAKRGRNKAYTPVAKAEFAHPDSKGDEEFQQFEPKTAGFSYLTITLREENVKVSKAVGDTMQMVDDVEFVVQLFENNKARNVPRKLSASLTFKDDQVQLWVTFFREVSRIKIHKFYPQSEKKHQNQDIVWTFTLPSDVGPSAKSAKEFFNKFKYACERMSLTKLAYAIVDRRAIVPAAKDNFHPMMSSSKAASILHIVGEVDDHPDLHRTAPTSEKHLRVMLDGVLKWLDFQKAHLEAHLESNSSGM